MNARAVAPLVALAALAGCGRPSPTDCKEAVDRYLAMTTPDPPRARDLTPAERDALREAAVGRRKADDSYAVALRRCESELRPRELTCMKNAPNADLWEACVE